MKKLLLILAAPLMICVTSCEVNSGLTTAEVVEGLKKALEIGTDSSTNKLSVVNGYYLDQLVKIPLPDEALAVKENIDAILTLAPDLRSFLNLDSQFENVVKSLNKAAESAASEASPVFGSAIRGLTISQGWDILNGIVPNDSGNKSAEFDSTAATQYFKTKTISALTSLYAPKIDFELDKDLGLGFSANQAWDILRTNYNKAVTNITGNPITNFALTATGYTLKPIKTESIGVFATDKALKGLFYKVGEEEKKIRKDPYKYLIDIIERVFGSVMQ